MAILEKIRKKPEQERKKILWIIVFLIGIVLVIFWVLYMKHSFSKIDFSNLRGPDVNTEDFKEAKERIENFQNKIKEKIKNNKNIKDIKEK